METLRLDADIECIEVRFQRPLRDPMGNADRYRRRCDWPLKELGGDVQQYFNKSVKEGNAARASDYAANAVDSVLVRMLLLYVSGEPLPTLSHRLSADLPFVMELKAIRAAVQAGSPVPLMDNTPAIFFRGNYNWSRFLSLGLICLLTPDSQRLASWLSIFRTDAQQQAQYPDERSFYIDVLLRAFQPDWPVDKNKHTLPKKGRPGERREVMEVLFRALAEPDKQARSEGLARYMAAWNRMMKPYGWKPSRRFPPLNPDGGEPSGPGADPLWTEFAFEAAMAVCGWDLDDSAFRGHPYYPREVVDHYRAHIRHTRDAWRGDGVGAGIPFDAPPLPPKADLAKSKRKGIERWIELVADGDADALVAVIEETGKPRKVKDLPALACALAQNRAGVYADIKDSDTLDAQVAALLDVRALEGFDPVGLPAAGPAHCSAVLHALHAWLSVRPYRLFALGEDGDAWAAVLVPRAYESEFQTMSAALGIVLVDPAAAFEE
jgi:hypothetical protein